MSVCVFNPAGDGNCAYRCLTYILHGSDINWECIKLAIILFIDKINNFKQLLEIFRRNDETKLGYLHRLMEFGVYGDSFILMCFVLKYNKRLMVMDTKNGNIIRCVIYDRDYIMGYEIKNEDNYDFCLERDITYDSCEHFKVVEIEDNYIFDEKTPIIFYKIRNFNIEIIKK